MRKHIKSVRRNYQSLLVLVLILVFSSVQTIVAYAEDKTDKTAWQMVWIGDFGEDIPHQDLEPRLENFIRKIKIYTSTNDGKLTTVSVSSGCNWIGLNTRYRVVEPARTTETFENGALSYHTVPAVYEEVTEWIGTQTACSNREVIDGKEYLLNWTMAVENFLSKNARNVTHIEKDNQLEWTDGTGKVIAKFQTFSEQSK